MATLDALRHTLHVDAERPLLLGSVQPFSEATTDHLSPIAALASKVGARMAHAMHRWSVLLVTLSSA